jgi:DNA-binding IclR family transcriptional regulator
MPRKSAGRKASTTHLAEGSPYRVQVLDRVFSMLDILALNTSDMTIPDLSAALGLHKSTVHRLLMVLEHNRFVERTADGRYCLGLRLFELGSRAVDRLNLTEQARPYLEKLVLEIGETAHLCILEDDQVLYVEKVEPARTVRMPSRVGRRNPPYCTAVGKALLAFLDDEALDALIQGLELKAYTRNTIVTPAALKKDLYLVRQRGYAVDNEEIEEGLKCIAAPVRNYSGRVIASLSIAGPAFRITHQTIPSVAKAVITIAAELSGALGSPVGNHRVSRRPTPGPR